MRLPGVFTTLASLKLLSYSKPAGFKSGALQFVGAHYILFNSWPGREVSRDPIRPARRAQEKASIATRHHRSP